MVQPKSGAKGYDMEEILRSYFLQAGYFVVRGIPFRIDGEDVTDVDLWLYERPAASTRRRLLVDIKNKKAPKAAERIVWAKGLLAALGMDGAIVATTDRRESIRRLAKSLGITLFDGDAISKLTSSHKLVPADQITAREFDDEIKKIDTARRSNEWRQTLFDARASLITSMGVQSANRCLAALNYFANQAVVAQPGSPQALLATRLVYLMGALATISIDFILADHAFRSIEERKAALINSIRFGQADVSPSMPNVRVAIGLARKYAENGAAVSKQIEQRFRADAEEIPAEIVADVVMRFAGSDAIFNLGRELEAVANIRAIRPYDTLSSDLKSMLGAYLDFSGVSRERFANACGIPPVAEREINEDSPAGPLFRLKQRAP